MIETARGLSALDEICAVPGLTGVYVGPADLAISLGYDLADAWTDPTVRDAMARVQSTASAAGLVTGIHAGTGKLGKAMAELGFRMITLASESQALRRGAAEHLAEATTQPDNKLPRRPPGGTSEHRPRRAGDRRRPWPGRGHREAAAQGRFPGRGLRSACRRADRDSGRVWATPCIAVRARRDVRRPVGNRGAHDRRTVRRVDHAGQQRRRAAPRFTGRRDARGVRGQLAGQLPRPVPRHPGRAAAPAAAPTARPS